MAWPSPATRRASARQRSALRRMVVRWTSLPFEGQLPRAAPATLNYARGSTRAGTKEGKKRGEAGTIQVRNPEIILDTKRVSGAKWDHESFRRQQHRRRQDLVGGV